VYLCVSACGDVIKTRENTQKFGMRIVMGKAEGARGATPPKSEVRFDPCCDDQLLLAFHHQLSPGIRRQPELSGVVSPIFILGEKT